MINASTLDKLSTLRLHEMATAWQEQQRIADHAALTFDERFGLLVDAQWLGRENRRLQRAMEEGEDPGRLGEMGELERRIAQLKEAWAKPMTDFGPKGSR
jgi:hypothetical protein